MARLNSYLLRLFSFEALTLFGVASVLLFLIQTLRLFDTVAAKGQGFLTLIGQSILGMPDILIVFLYICLGIALGRALRGLQGRGELQIIHSSQLVPALLRSVVDYALLGTLALLLLAHVISPISIRTNNEWSAKIAADFVGRSLVPHQFTAVVRGVTLEIGSRSADGVLGDFFADDRRNPTSRRTYIAKSASIGQDADGYVLQLRDGVVQYMSDQKEFSQITFQRYDLGLDRLTGESDSIDITAQTPSYELVANALASGVWDEDIVHALAKRTVEGLRVIAMCLFVAALAGFPSGARRRFSLPIELTVLATAFIERGFSSYLTLPGIFYNASGALLLLVLALLMLASKLRMFQRAPMRGAAA